MKQKIAVLALSCLVFSVPARAEFTGQVKLACEAILCLSTGSPPTQCAPSLAAYFGIDFEYWSDTLQGRINFLNLCPSASADDNMRSLTNAIANGAGRCDVVSLNRTFGSYSGGGDGFSTYYISNNYPSYCASYTSHNYTDFNSSQKLPVFVGLPNRGGQWVEAQNYDAALKAYNERIRREDEEQRYNNVN